MVYQSLIAYCPAHPLPNARSAAPSIQSNMKQISDPRCFFQRHVIQCVVLKSIQKDKIHIPTRTALIALSCYCSVVYNEYSSCQATRPNTVGLIHFPPQFAFTLLSSDPTSHSFQSDVLAMGRNLYVYPILIWATRETDIEVRLCFLAILLHDALFLNWHRVAHIFPSRMP